jgi:hypothetical protein
VDQEARPTQRPCRHKRKPADPVEILLSELWAARLGNCEEWKLEALPAHANGLPSKFNLHPLRFVDHKIQACLGKQPANKTASKSGRPGQQYFCDFGFIWSSTSNYSHPNPATDRIVHSVDGLNCYLLVVDEFSRYAWVFLCASKEPPIDKMSAFLWVFGLKEGGVLRCDQGGELSKSTRWHLHMLMEFNYKVEPAGADSPSRNGGVARFNQTLGTMTRALLYGASPLAEYWSYALVHSVYLLNHLVRSCIKRTPYEALSGTKPDLSHLQVFGSRVCVRRTETRRAKLDRHDFRGIFLGYTATNQNIIYMDIDSGLVKTSHHAFFDKAWYMQQSHPPAAQLLFDCGTVALEDLTPPPSQADPPSAIYPTINYAGGPPLTDLQRAIHTPLPLCLSKTPPSHIAMGSDGGLPTTDPHAGTFLASHGADGEAVLDNRITARDMAQVYISPHAHNNGFLIELDLRHSRYHDHPTCGFKFTMENDQLILQHIEKSTLASRIPCWWSTLRGAWLQQVGDVTIRSLQDVQQSLATLITSGTLCFTLIFSHPEIPHGLTNNDIPQVNIDQLNPKSLFSGFSLPDVPVA